MNVPAMKFKMPEKHLEIGVVVEEGFALWIGDMNGEDAVKVVGLDETAVITKKNELLVDLELMTDYGFEMGHFHSPCEIQKAHNLSMVGPIRSALGEEQP